MPRQWVDEAGEFEDWTLLTSMPMPLGGDFDEDDTLLPHGGIDEDTLQGSSITEDNPETMQLTLGDRVDTGRWPGLEGSPSVAAAPLPHPAVLPSPPVVPLSEENTALRPRPAEAERQEYPPRPGRLQPPTKARLSPAAPAAPAAFLTGAHEAFPGVASYPFLPILSLTTPQQDDQGTDLMLEYTIGEGGAGRVSLATQRSLFREVAIKSVKPDARVPNPERMLLHEGIITGHLEHPNIIPVHALGFNEDHEPLLVMKYVQGVPWSDLLADDSHPFWSKRLSWSRDPLTRHLEVLIDVCQAVEYAHNKGIIHRDIKPQNVMLGAYGEVYLLDWGLAHLVDPRSELAPILKSTFPLDEREGFFGTPMYMAPEMLEEETELGRFTDVYLLGACMFEIIHGHPPHQGETIEEVILSAFHTDVLEVAEDCPGELARICQRALHPEPELRYQDAGALREAMVAFLKHRGSRELSDAANEQLEALRQLHAQAAQSDFAENKHHIYKVYNACRFGFLQSLREWDKNPEARRGMAAAIELMFEVECQQGNLDAAEALLLELEVPSAQLHQTLARLRREREEEHKEKARLQDMQRELDFSVARRQQYRLMLLMGLFASAFALIRMALGEAATLTEGYRRSLIFVGLSTTVLVAGLVWGRKELFQNDVNRRYVGLLLLCSVVVLANRVVHALERAPLHEAFRFDLVLIACVAISASLALRPWLAWVGLLLLSGAGVSKWMPAHTYHIMTFCIAAAWLLCGYFWGKERTPQELLQGEP